MSTARPTTTTPTVLAPRVTSRSATLLQVMAIAVLLATIGWVAVQVFVTDATVPAQPITVGQVDEAAETARLVAEGLVPAATLGPSGEEAETARLVARGLIPAETLQPIGEEAVTRSLINRGLVPEGTQP
jgi:hypothetical protein